MTSGAVGHIIFNDKVAKMLSSPIRYWSEEGKEGATELSTDHSCSARVNRIFGEKCAHFSALYYVNALHVFLGFFLFS